ncbi:MAG: AAA family ATPase [Gammaproteobacteria bacterium]|nr:AAA family ATPase [Gammaproteobacteria bacterium]
MNLNEITPEAMDDHNNLFAGIPDPKENPAEKSMASNKFELIRSTELTNEPKDFQWLIKSIMEKGNLIEIFGSPESGKSLITLDMSFCISCGIDWNGHKVSQGNVVYIAGEGFGGLARRIKALETKYDRKAENLFLSKAPAELLDSSSAMKVSDAIAEICGETVLVVIDTLNRNFGAGDESSTKDMTTFIGNIDYYLKDKDESVIVVHHSGLSDKDRSRGSSSLLGALDLQYKVLKSGSKVTFGITKAKDVPEPAPMCFEIEGIPIEWMDEDGINLTAPILHAAEYVAKEIKTSLSQRDELSLSTLRASTESHGIEPSLKMKSTFAGLEGRNVVHIDHWRDTLYPRLDVDGGQDAKKKAFQRTRTKLLTCKKIANMDDYFWEIFYAN